MRVTNIRRPCGDRPNSYGNDRVRLVRGRVAPASMIETDQPRVGMTKPDETASSFGHRVVTALVLV